MTTTRRTLIATITPQGEGPPLMVGEGFSGIMPVVGVPFTGFTFIGIGGVPPYAFAIPGGGLPPGLVLQPDGKITGTPTTQGWYQFQAQVTDGASQVSGLRTYAFTVGGGLKAPSLKLPLGARAVAYSFQYRATDASGSTAGITYALQSGTLPPGLSINSTGLVSGIPTSQGYFSVVIRATKGSVYYDFHNRYQINSQFTTAGSVVTITDPLKNMVVGVPVRGQIEIKWPLATMPVGIAAYQWTIAAGALPPGLTLSNDGTIKGTPTAPTPFNYVQPTFAVTDKAGTTINVTLVGTQRLVVAAAVKATSPNRFLLTDSDGSPMGVNFLALFFSAGQDGDAVLDGVNQYPWAILTGGNYTLTRDIYLNNLTINAGISLDMSSNCVFGKGRADLKLASAGAIYASAFDGQPGTSSGGGQPGGPGTSPSSLGYGGIGSAGAAGVVGSPAASGNVPSMDVGYGGLGWAAGGNAGKGGPGTGGTASGVGGFGSLKAFAGYPFPVGPLAAAIGPIGGGTGGVGGGAGAGDGSTKGGSGGGGGAGGPTCMFCFYEIETGPSTAAGVFKTIAGAGGWGQNVSAANVGGGGGGQGGGGGYFHIRYGLRTGSAVASAVWADGGNGGIGGTNSANSFRNGYGGAGGHGGTVEIINLLTGDVTVVGESVAPTGATAVAGGSGGRTRATL